MSRFPRLLILLLACAIALAPSLAFARAGGGSSMGSRGGFTYSAPPATRTAPSGAAPMERSLTPQAPTYGAPSYGPGYRAPAYGGRSPFVSGLMGGLIGAGIGGLLFGHGLFGGFTGFGSFIGLLLQIFLIVMVVRFLFRMFAGRMRPAGGAPNIFARGPGGPMGAGAMPGGGGQRVGQLTITPQDFQAFEQILKDVQAGWSAHNLQRLQQLATPEMVSYFADQLGEQSSRGVRNTVSDVRLEQGDLAQAWTEQGREYATVAMRFSMNDVTVDSSGRVVDGDPTLRTMVTELWTFVRAPGGRWLLSAIQQVR
jgi:predicted lipid-binding transport protein (Tim44 family)